MINENKILLCRLMDMDELEYNMKVYDSAFIYLDRIIPDPMKGKQVLGETPFFWRWWTLQWERRNRILIHDLNLEEYTHIITPDAKIFIKAQFNDIHDPHSLRIYPNKAVLEQVLQRIISKGIEHNKAIIKKL